MFVHASAYVCVHECGLSDNQLSRTNNKGHSLSQSVYVIVPISVCDFVLTVIVTIAEASDLCLYKIEDHIIVIVRGFPKCLIMLWQVNTDHKDLFPGLP